MSYGRGQRVLDLPPEAITLICTDASKADIFEAAWHLAALCNAGEGPDDHRATQKRLLDEINLARAARGARPIKPWHKANTP